MIFILLDLYSFCNEPTTLVVQIFTFNIKLCRIDDQGVYCSIIRKAYLFVYLFWAVLVFELNVP
jgi:hypothetical protein